jgi:GNAT superfamily N-acetyltransferase
MLRKVFVFHHSLTALVHYSPLNDPIRLKLCSPNCEIFYYWYLSSFKLAAIQVRMNHIVSHLRVPMAPVQNSLAIRPFEAHEWPKYREARLRSLADSPDAFSSTLAEAQDRSLDDWAARLAAATVSGQDYPLIAELDGDVIGLAWAKVDATTSSVVNLFQMWVAPESRGRGVAAALLREAIKWARSRNAHVVQLGVTCGNASAVRLYAREGFRDFGSPEPRGPGSPLLEQTMRLAIKETAG